MRGLLSAFVIVVALPAMSSCGEADDGSSTVGDPSTMPTATSTSTGPAPTATDPPAPCAEGVQRACTCPDGSSATEVCTGGAFGPCACPLPPSAWNLLGCFTRADEFANCELYCRDRGRQCAAESCNIDGSRTEFGYTWVSWPAAEAPACETLEPPPQVSFDACTTPIWLQPTKADDDVVRCCCL